MGSRADIWEDILIVADVIREGLAPIVLTGAAC